MASIVSYAVVFSFMCMCRDVAGVSDVNNFLVEIKSELPGNMLSVILQNKDVKYEIDKLISALEDATNEYLAYEEMVVNDKIRTIADKISCMPKDDNYVPGITLIIRELMEYYYQCKNKSQLLVNFVKKSPDFCFCIGICGYFLSEQSEQDVSDIGIFFKNMTGTDMTRQAGLEQIERSTSEHAYWFKKILGA